MPPKSSAANGKAPAAGKTAFLPPQRTQQSSLASKDPQATLVDKPSASGSHGAGVGGRPDKGVYDKEQESIKAEIDVLQAKMNEVKNQIGGKGASNPLAEKRKALREELDGLREQQSKHKSSRDHVFDQIKAAQEAMQRKIKDLNAAKAKLPFKSVAEVDAKIQTLERSVEAGTLKIVDEKRALADIQALKKQRRQVESFSVQQEAIEADRAKVDELRKQLDDPEGKATSQKWADIKAALDKISAEMAEQGKGRDKLFDQRNDLQKQLDDAYSRKRESAGRYKEANDKFYAKLQEDRQRKIERNKAERDAYEASKRLEDATRMRDEASAPAYEREIEDCRTLIGYFEKVTGAASSTAAGGVAEPKLSDPDGAVGSKLPQLGEARQVDEDLFKGMTVVKKKGDGDDAGFFMGGGGKKGKSAKRGEAKSGAGAGAQSLQLPLATLTALLALGVPTPMTREEIPATVASLTEKRKYFTENQDRVTKDRIAAAERKISAAEAKTKGGAAPPTGADEGKAPVANGSSTAAAAAPTPIEAVAEVKGKLGDEALPVDRHGVAVDKVVDESGADVVPPAEEL